MNNDFIKKSRIFLICLLAVYLLSLVSASIIASVVDSGSLLPLTFGFALLIFSLYTAPFLFCVFFLLSFFREVKIYKEYLKSKKRFVLSLISTVLYALSLVSLLLYFLQHYFFILPAIVLSVACVITYVISLTI